MIAAISFVQGQGGLLIQGAMTGLAYGLLAVGLILVYRATRVINFAHTYIGALAATVMAKLMLDDGWSYVPAVAAALLSGLSIGALIEFFVVRPLFDRPRLVVLVGTLGAAQILSAGIQLLPQIQHPAPFPAPVAVTANIGATTLDGGDFALLVAVPITVLVLAWWWKRSAYGLAVRAIAENADGARLAAIPVKRVSLLVFVIAGGLSALAIVLLDPARAVVAGTSFDTLGPSILLRALLAASIGRFSSMPKALAGGVAVGMIESELYAHTVNPGYVDGYLFLLLCACVLGFARSADTDLGSWSLAPTIPPIPRELLRRTWLRYWSVAGRCACVLIAVALPMILTKGSAQFTLAEIALYGLIGASAVVLTGWSGQLSLAQYAFAGIGAFATARLMAHGFGFLPSVLLTTVIGTLLACGLGIPALRIRGVYLAVVTLGFAVAVANWLLPSSLLSAGQTIVSLTPDSLGPLNLSDQRTYYWLCLAILVIVFSLLTWLRRGSFGRAMIAVRDNETAASAFGFSPALIKILAFALSGGIATLAGGLLGGLLGTFSSQSFSPDQSLTILTMIVIGGVANLTGAIAGAVGIVGIPTLLGTYISGLSNDVQSLQLLLSGLAVVQILSKQPGGMAQGLLELRERLARLTAVRAAAPAEARGMPIAERTSWKSLVPRDQREPRAGLEALRLIDVSVRFGGIVANDGVSLDVAAGEIIGLIGNNGAGKTTLMNAVSGFVRTEGAISMYGEGISHLPAHRRARRGIARCFQGAHLFAGLTVGETLECAMDRRGDRPNLGKLIGRRQRLESRSEELAADFGLTALLDTPVADLSTGTRRVVEFACVAACRPSLILLDEPTAGVAQREVEAFGPLLRDLRDLTGAAIVIVEHDLPLVMSVSDRLVALGEGRVIAVGDPEQVRNDRAVIESYLGSDEVVINRSLHPAVSTAERSE